MSKLIISIIASVLCELIYIVIVLIGGKIFNIETELTLQELSMCIIDTILIIIVYCSIYNFVSMIFSEATISTIINVIILVLFFVLAFYYGKTSDERKYYGSITSKDGIVTSINRYPNPNYPGDEKVNFAKNVEFSTPVGQAFAMFNLEEYTSMSALYDDNAIFNTKEKILRAILIYSVAEICIINILGISIFSKRELK